MSAASARGLGGGLLLLAVALVLIPAGFVGVAVERVGALLARNSVAPTAEQLAFLRRSVYVHAGLTLTVVAAATALLFLLLQRRSVVPRLVPRFFGLAALTALFEWHSARRAVELGLDLESPLRGLASFLASLVALLAGGVYLAVSRRARETLVN